jgi:hypothetical protein
MRQTPPNSVSADSPSRILPGDVLVSLRSPPPQRSYNAASGGAEILGFIFGSLFVGQSKIEKRMRDHSLARGIII